MLFALLEMLSWFQPEAAAPSGGGGGHAGGAGGGPIGADGGCATQAGLLVVMMAVFYFMLIRPQQKRQKEHDSMLKALRPGVVVRTTGGIRGEIVTINEREAMLARMEAKAKAASDSAAG